MDLELHIRSTSTPHHLDTSSDRVNTRQTHVLQAWHLAVTDDAPYPEHVYRLSLSVFGGHVWSVHAVPYVGVTPYKGGVTRQWRFPAEIPCGDPCHT